MKKFNISSKKVNRLKLLFKKQFKDSQAYEQFIENHVLEEILEEFEKLLSE